MKSILAAVICASTVLAHGDAGHFHGPRPSPRPKTAVKATFNRVDGPGECPKGTEFDLESCTCQLLGRCKINCAGNRKNNPLKRCGCMSE